MFDFMDYDSIKLKYIQTTTLTHTHIKHNGIFILFNYPSDVKAIHNI